MSWLSFLGQRGGDETERREATPDPASERAPDTTTTDTAAEFATAEAATQGGAAGGAAGDASGDASGGQPGDGSWNFEALKPEPPAPAQAAPGFASDPLKTLELKPQIVEALSTVFDPEIPVNIYELGLIYDVIIDAEARVQIKMTLTSPACPAAQQLPGEVQDKVRRVPGVKAAAVEIVWDPPWSPERMSDVARLQLGFF
ncbi:MAG: SUF system Fe-S cluster assembly protein [Vicinamibacteraceae bacterium]|nr:SUF system Fe-S cluster assembly protein [Vicinamibacteraceae bacterium]